MALFVTLGAAWRLWLGTVYAGWEESDYGNLAMVRGVLDGHLLHYDMNHMPGYYAISALVLALVGDPVVAARAVSLAGGLVALGLAVSLAHRLLGPRVAWLAGALLVVQPEFALYAASSLREPLDAAFVMACLAALVAERPLLAGVAAGLAFFVRFDSLLALSPALLLHLAARPPRWRRLAGGFLPLAAAVGAWSLYTRLDHGTWRFWSHSVQVNLDTGLGAEALSTGAWLLAGARVVGALALGVLPSRIGWGLVLGLVVTVLATARHGPRRTWLALALGMSAVWLGMGFVAQHEPAHNLYWKWLCPVIPVLVPVAAWGVFRAADALTPLAGRPAAVALVVLVVLQAGVAALVETRRQVGISNDLYRPQLELARWLEAEVPEDVPLLVDNIPACWLNRRHHARSLTSWFDVPSRPGDAASFATWLEEARIGWVLWFREDWTQAPLVAPFLAEGGTWERGGVRLVEVDREDGYGWILFRVERSRP